MHIPVLKKEILAYLDPRPNENFIDATCGWGGHTEVILERSGPRGKVLAIEWDPELYNKLKEKFAALIDKRLILKNDSYTHLKEIVAQEKFMPISGILFDLGMSSWHLEGSGRGFSFLRNEPLDMRYGKGSITARSLLNESTEKEIEIILREYGEERFSKRIVKGIIEQRKNKPLKTTFELVEIIKKAVPLKYHYLKTHCATRSFQAIRIAVNDEINNLKRVLEQTLQILPKGGRVVILSFHSLEDRIVKNFFKEQDNYFKIITKKPVIATKEEVKINPRSRSAKMRAALKI